MKKDILNYRSLCLQLPLTVVFDLKEYFGEPYTNAYYEISKVLRKYEFYNVQGSIYLSQNNDMANHFRAIDALKKIE